MKEVQKISRLIYIFQTFRKVNIAALLYKKMSKSWFTKWIYYIIPIILFAINIFNMISKNVLYSSEDKFTYFIDLSNSMCLTLLSFLSYFLSGYYPLKFDEFVVNGIDKDFFCKMTKYSHNRKKYKWLLILIGIILFSIAMTVGYSFYSVAESAGENIYWIDKLDSFGRIYYCFFLGLTWYHSLSLLGMALTSGFIVYKTIEYGHLIYIEELFNKNVSIMNAVDIVLSTFSYGLFYIIGSFIFIFNDKMAMKYEINNTFSEDIPSFILVLLITLLAVLAYLPLQELLVFLKKKKAFLINSLNERISGEEIVEERDQLILERNNLLKQNLIYTSMANKAIFILSVLIPSIGVILQGIDLFVK